MALGIREASALDAKQPEEAERFDKSRLLAPALVSVLRYSIQACLCFVAPHWLALNLHNVIYWSTSLLTLLVYLRASLTDPGYQRTCPSTWLSVSGGRQIVPVDTEQPERVDQIEVLMNQNAKVFPLSEESSEELDDVEMCVKPSFDLAASDSEAEGGIVLRPALSGDARALETKRRAAEVALNVDLHSSSKNARSKAASLMKGWCWRVCHATRRVPAGVMFFAWQSCASLTKSASSAIKVALIPLIGYRRKEEHEESKIDSVDALFSTGVSAIYQRNEKLLFCRFCQIWQPLRTKHCKSCQRCVRLHDHHCMWLGTCVGERNRVLFLYYLGAETVEIVWTLSLIVYSLFFRDLDWLTDATEPSFLLIVPRVYLITTCIILVSLAFMTFGLFFYHLILMGMNLTTWEVMVWHKVSYLKRKGKAHGSPFALPDVLSNFELCCHPAQFKLTPTSFSREACELSGMPRHNKFIWGPEGEQLWIPAKPGDVGYRQLSGLLVNRCYNLYDFCI